MKLVGPLLFSCLVLIAACASTSRPPAGVSRIEAGHDLAREKCARCHGIGRRDDSPLAKAPPFRRLHERYPIEDLEEAFAEGIVVGHTEMPAFQLQPQEIAALLAYLKSLEAAPARY